jgi:hypothetical protein
LALLQLRYDSNTSQPCYRRWRTTLQEPSENPKSSFRFKQAHLAWIVAALTVGYALAMLFRSNAQFVEGVVQKAMEPNPMAREMPEDTSVAYYVQAGAFLDASQAQVTVELLKSLGMPTEIREREKAGHRTYVVLAGPMTSAKKVFWLREELYIRGFDTIKMRKAADGSLFATG